MYASDAGMVRLAWQNEMVGRLCHLLRTGCNKQWGLKKSLSLLSGALPVLLLVQPRPSPVLPKIPADHCCRFIGPLGVASTVCLHACVVRQTHSAAQVHDCSRVGSLHSQVPPGTIKRLELVPSVGVIQPWNWAEGPVTTGHGDSAVRHAPRHLLECSTENSLGLYQDPAKSLVPDPLVPKYPANPCIPLLSNSFWPK